MKYCSIAVLFTVAALSNLFSSCIPSQTATPISHPPTTILPTQVESPTTTSRPTITPTLPPTPIITLEKGASNEDQLMDCAVGAGADDYSDDGDEWQLKHLWL